MKEIISVLLLVLTLSVLSSCGTSKQDSSQSDRSMTEEKKLNMNPPPPPPPGSCTIVGQVETIDRTLKGTNEQDPCGKAPCNATIRIESVLACGSSMPRVLSAGQTLQVKFAHTLNPTKDVWPDIKPPLPGLRVKDQFEAVVSAAEVMGSSEPMFTIYAYEKK